MHLYISAESNNVYFISTVKQYCAGSRGRHSCVFLPDAPSLPGETYPRKMMNNMVTADLILVDATPRKVQVKANEKTRRQWLTDPRVIAEYAIAVSLGKTDDIKVYCRVSPSHMAEIFHDRTVEFYPLDNKEAFLKYLDDLVSRMEQEPRRLMRRSRIGASYS